MTKLLIFFIIQNWKPPSVENLPLHLSTENEQSVNIDKKINVSVLNDNITNIKTSKEQKIESFADFSDEKVTHATTKVLKEEVQLEEEVQPAATRQNWAGFDDFNNEKSTLPTSDSDFFSKAKTEDSSKNNGLDSFIDPFAPIIDSTNNDVIF